MPHDLSIADLNCHSGADRISIALGPLQLQPYPMIRRLGFVMQEDRRLPAIVERQIHVSVIIVIAGGQSSADMPLLKIRAGHSGDVLEATPSVVEKKLRLLTKRIVRIAVFIDIARDMAVAHDNVQAAIPIDVEKASAEAKFPPTGRTQAGTVSHIQKLTLALLPALISKEGVCFASKGGGEQIRQAVAVEIVGVHAHIGLRIAGQIDQAATARADGFETSIPEIAEKEIRDRIVGHKDIHQTVAVEVERDHSQGFGIRHINPGLMADIREGKIAVVPVKDAASPLESGRRTGIPLIPLIGAARVVFQIDENITANKKIQSAVIVVVQKSGAGAEIRPFVPVRVVRQPGAGGDVFESPAAFAVFDIVIEDIGLSVTGEK